MLLDSNIIIYSSKREYAELRRFLTQNVYSVSAVSRIEVLGYHLLATEQHQYLIEFFQAADVLRISEAVVTEATSSDRPSGWVWVMLSWQQQLWLIGLRWSPEIFESPE